MHWRYKQKKLKIKESDFVAEADCVLSKEHVTAEPQKVCIISDWEKLRFFQDPVTPKCGHGQLFNLSVLCGWQGFTEHNALTEERINNFLWGNILPSLA